MLNVDLILFYADINEIIDLNYITAQFMEDNINDGTNANSIGNGFTESSSQHDR